MKKKKQIIFLIICAVSLLFLGVCLVRISHWKNLLETQHSAERWSGDSDITMAQISCFMPVGGEIGESEIYSFRSALDSKLTEAAITAPENGSLYIDGYSARGNINVSGDRGSAAASAIGIGGDYFFFHPLELLSGSYISGDDLMHDRVVLDEELAWKLFGSSDLAGMTVTINEKPYYIAGVVRRETDAANSKAYSDGAGIFLAYDELTSADSPKINCYEISMPNPLSGFAMDIVSNSFPLGSGTALENSRRYSFGTILGFFKNYGERSMQISGVVMPYWENAARYTEDRVALLFVFVFLFSLAPAALLFISVSLIIRIIKRGTGRIKSGIKDIYEYGLPQRSKDAAKRCGILSGITRRLRPSGKHLAASSASDDIKT